jgi:hypothetical protein
MLSWVVGKHRVQLSSVNIVCNVTPVASAGLREQSIELDCRKLGIPIARHLLRRAHGPHEGRVGPPPLDPIPSLSAILALK